MRVRLVRRPGQHGTRTYVEQYGDKLVCVRYRYDEAARRRYKTIELIVDEKEWEPSPLKLTKRTMVGVRLKSSDRASYEKLRTMSASWDFELQVWHLRYATAVALGLAERIIGTIEELRAARASGEQHRRPE